MKLPRFINFIEHDTGANVYLRISMIEAFGFNQVTGKYFIGTNDTVYVIPEEIYNRLLKEIENI